MIYFLDDLFKRTVLKESKSLTALAATKMVNVQKTRGEYTLSLLRAPLIIRIQAQQRMAASTYPGQKQLAGILAQFNVLPLAKQVAFIKAYARRATTACIMPRLGSTTTYSSGSGSGGGYRP